MSTLVHPPAAALEIVLAPGLLCDDRLWAPVRARLASPARTLDFTRDETLAAMAARILAEAPARFVLAGFSMGGMAAMLAAAAAPQRVAGLALIDTHAEADTAERRAMRQRQIEAAQAGRFDALVAELKPAYFADPAAHAEERALVAEMARAQGPERFSTHVRAIMDRGDLAAAARTLAMPVRVVTGAEDRLAPPAFADTLAQLIPGAQLTVLPGCGHLAPLERPAELAAILDDLAAQTAATELA